MHQVLASCRGVRQGPCLCVPATYRAAFQARCCCLKGPPLSLFVVVGTTLWLCMLGAALSRPPCTLYMYMLACASLAALFPKGVPGQCLQCLQPAWRVQGCGFACISRLVSLPGWGSAHLQGLCRIWVQQVWAVVSTAVYRCCGGQVGWLVWVLAVS